MRNACTEGGSRSALEVFLQCESISLLIGASARRRCPKIASSRGDEQRRRQQQPCIAVWLFAHRWQCLNVCLLFSSLHSAPCALALSDGVAPSDSISEAGGQRIAHCGRRAAAEAEAEQSEQQARVPAPIVAARCIVRSVKHDRSVRRVAACSEGQRRECAKSREAAAASFSFRPDCVRHGGGGGRCAVCLCCLRSNLEVCMAGVRGFESVSGSKQQSAAEKEKIVLRVLLTLIPTESLRI